METITTQYKGGMQFETRIGKHTLSIDVPPTMGGSDRGPTPPNLFVASLGSCIAAFVAEYCEKNGIDTAGLTVDLNFEKASNPTRLADLKAVVNIPNGTCAQRLDAIRRVAEFCPVHQTIKTMQELEITIRSKDGC